MGRPVLHYFVDPMCSWCWGFAPVIDAIKRKFDDRLKIALVFGGLRPGATEPLTNELRSEILHHWRAVQNKTGQLFTFDGAMPKGFIYNTEPPSRAVVAVSEIRAGITFEYFKAVQSAFYVEQLDVTQAFVLTQIAQTFDIDPQQFKQQFESGEVKQKILKHFAKSRQFGVQGFPSIVMQIEESYHLLTHGYKPYKQVEPEIERCLDSI